MGFNVTRFPPGAFHVRRAPIPFLLPQTDFLTEEDYERLDFIRWVHALHCCLVIMACEAVIEQLEEEDRNERRVDL